MATELLEPVVDAGIRLTNFFNGRVLTADDLRREQDAAREHRRGLAAAVGEGVVHGLEVTVHSRSLAAPTVRVTAGLAFNREGDPVVLPHDVDLRLIPATAEQDAMTGVFAVCDPPAVQVEITNPGFYLLVARPASAYSHDRVAAVDVASEGVGTRCASRYTEQGASFALVPLPLPAVSADVPLSATLVQLASSVATDVESVRRGDGSDAGLPARLAKNLSKLRSGMAYWCAGHDAAGQRIIALAVPTSAPSAVSLSPIEALRATGRLAPCDVPIALVYVTRRQLEWVDMWTVRRPPLPRLGPDPLSLASLAHSGREATALMLQFRDHAASFFAADTPAAAHTVAAPDWFLFLPPAGILPVKTGALPGFAPGTFFPWIAGYEQYAAWQVPKSWVDRLLRNAAGELPIRLGTSTYPALYRFTSDTGESMNWSARYIMFVAQQGFGYYLDYAQ